MATSVKKGSGPKLDKKKAAGFSKTKTAVSKDMLNLNARSSTAKRRMSY